MFTKELYKFDTTNPKPIIIDLGANFGLSTIYFKQLYPKAKIVALEADPFIFKCLEHNVSAFSWDANDIELINMAAWDSSTTINFLPDNGLGGRLKKDDMAGTIRIQTMDVLPLLERFPKIDLLKIDIEGAEMAVLERCGNLLKKAERIFVEFHSSVSDRTQKLSGLLSILEKHNFRYWIQGGYSELFPFSGNAPFVNTRFNDPQQLRTGGFDLQLDIWAVRDNLKDKR